MVSCISPHHERGHEMKKIGMVSLGCPKNLVDSEVLLGDLTRNGYELTPQENEADILIVNTCGFLQASVKESIDTILDMARHKTSGQCRQLIVTGCLAERHPEELLAEIPEIDHLLGTKQYPLLRSLLNGNGQQRNHVHEPAQYFEAYGDRVLTTPFYSAYVKIAEGCSNKCAFCIIPKLRGPIQSRPLASIVEEVRQLAEGGVKEINGRPMPAVDRHRLSGRTAPGRTAGGNSGNRSPARHQTIPPVKKSSQRQRPTTQPRSRTGAVF